MEGEMRSGREFFGLEPSSREKAGLRGMSPATGGRRHRYQRRDSTGRLEGKPGGEGPGMSGSLWTRAHSVVTDGGGHGDNGKGGRRGWVARDRGRGLLWGENRYLQMGGT